MSVLDAGLEKKRGGKKTIIENYSNTDLRRIVRAVNKKLRECEDGTDTTTCQLIMAAGYDVNKLSEGDLLDIHEALFRAAKASNITLDMSAHEGLVEGLPYNLDFIVRQN